LTLSKIKYYIIEKLRRKLDKDVVLKQLDDVEQKIEKLIELSKSLESKNAELENKIVQLEQELQNRVEAERSYTEEKSLVRSKIDDLLIKLNGF